MARDSKLLKKMYLFNETTFQKIKDIEDTERNFNALDKEMHDILYSKKMNAHEKLTKYKQLLEKYIYLRKQLLTKYGNQDDKLDQIKRKRNSSLRNSSFPENVDKNNPFESQLENTNFPRLSNIFNNTDIPENFNFNQQQSVPTFNAREQPIVNTPKEDFFETDGVIDDEDLYIPSTSTAAVARDSFIQSRPSLGDVTMQDVSEKTTHSSKKDTQLKLVKWKDTSYHIRNNLVDQFKIFLKKVERWYPNAKRVEMSDFANYLVNRQVTVKPTQEVTAKRMLRKRKSSVRKNDSPKLIKKEQRVTDFFPEVKKKDRPVLRPSRLQHGKGKWISFR